MSAFPVFSMHGRSSVTASIEQPYLNASVWVAELADAPDLKTPFSAFSTHPRLSKTTENIVQSPDRHGKSHRHGHRNAGLERNKRSDEMSNPMKAMRVVRGISLSVCIVLLLLIYGVLSA